MFKDFQSLGLKNREKIKAKKMALVIHEAVKSNMPIAIPINPSLEARAIAP